MHVDLADALKLLGLPHIDHPRIYFDNLNNFVAHPATEHKKSTTRKFGHTFVQWSLYIEFHFTDIDLRRLHCRFGQLNTE